MFMLTIGFKRVTIQLIIVLKGAVNMNIKGEKAMPVQINARVPQEAYEYIERLAKENDRSKSDIVRYMIEYCKKIEWRP